MTSQQTLGRVRLARLEDTPHIQSLLNESISMNFRVICADDIIHLIENGVLSICQLDSNDAVIGFISTMDFPLIPSVHPAAWEQYIWTKYKAIELNARNTLFIHLLCWDRNYGRDCVDNMLKSIFMHDPYVHYIALVKSVYEYPWLIPGHFRAEGAFRRVPVAEKGANLDKLPSLNIADRTTVSPRLKIRRAVEADNDDLVPIIHNQAERLRELYGDFYISELISKHPESDRVLLVCEHNELAVGVMCLNTLINYEALEESFILSPYAGFRHMTCENREKEECDGSSTSFTVLPADDSKPQKEARSKVKVTEDEEVKDLRFEPSVGVNKISVTLEEPKLDSLELDSLELDSLELDIYDLFEHENCEEELEFDIVNIDEELLIVPELLNYESVKGPAAAVMKIINGKTEDKEKPKKVKPNRSSSTVIKDWVIREPPLRRYSGEPNAFIIELFAMHSDYDERYGFDMLEVAYEMFPDRDYCILCLPSNLSAFPLLEHFTLVVPNNCTNKAKFVNESLYVAHVNSVRGSLRVRPGEAADIAHLIDVLEHAPHENILLDLYRSTFESHTLQSFVVLSENQPAGVVMLGPLEENIAVRNQYDLDPEPRYAGADGVILTGVISPVLSPHVRWILRELMRQSIYCTLFWVCRLFGRGDESPGRNLMSLSGHMFPVHPRHSTPNLSGSNLNTVFKDLGDPFALWMMERPLTSLPKVYVNSSIVVVGASCTGLAFLETLLMGPTSQYLTFSNLTLISENGLPTFADCLKAAAKAVPRDGRYTDRYLKSVPFYYYVDVISNVMIGIDRKKKRIFLKSGDIKYYDILVLTCGQQFQHPEYLKDSLDLVKEVGKGKPCDRILMDNPKYQPDRVPANPRVPDNVMLINSLYEANICLRKLMRMIGDRRSSPSRLSKTNQVVVYGECIEAYSCIAALLELGLSADLIVFVEPFPAADDPTQMRVNCFNNETVDERVQLSLHRIGIRVIRHGHLSGWTNIDNNVQSLDIMTALHYIKLNCFVMFYYGLSAISLISFRAVNECGLVYDGGIVVNPTFETNDPNIYAAGTCVRYSRRLYAIKRLHRNYCSEDIGEALARLFLIKLDPFVMSECDLEIPRDLVPSFSHHSSFGFRSSVAGSLSSAHLATVLLTITSSSRRWQPVIKFESPIIQAATLPGPLYYMKVRKPGKEVPQAVHKTLPKRGHTLITDEFSNFFCLQLNVLHVIDAVICLSHKQFSTEIMSQLYGKHEAFFDKMLYRFESDEIEDFYKYFTQPWMSVLYQENFKELLNNINQQDITAVSDLLKSKHTPYYDDAITSKSVLDRSPSIPVFTFDGSVVSLFNIYASSKGLRQAHTFRSLVINTLASKTDMNKLSHAQGCVPLRCGQSEKVRNEVATYWKRVGGDKIVVSHLANYLNSNPANNPQYATAKFESI